MVDGINSFANNPIYQYHYQQYQEMKKKYGSDLTFQGYLRQCNVDFDYSMSGFENIIETGDSLKGDGVKGNTLSQGRYINNTDNRNNQMYQTEDLEGVYDIDWATGNYTYINDVQEVAQKMGLDTENYNVDTIVFGENKAEITDFTFGGLDDGQDRTEYNLTGVYDNITFAMQEFDPCYLVDSGLMDETDPEYQKAMANWEYLSATANQWMTQEDLDKLNAMDPASAEYKTALVNIILDKLDQIKEFAEHTHVENTASVEGSDDSYNTGTEKNENTTVPTYNLDELLQNSGLAKQYYGDETWYGSKHYDKSSRKESALNDARSYVEEQLTNYVNVMITHLGEQCTDEIKTYLLAAKNAVLQSNVINTEHNNRFMAKDTEQGKINIKNMIDEFNKQFNSLCSTGGKTVEEVEQDEANRQALKSSYQGFYDTKLKSLNMKDEKIKASYTTSMVNGNYKEDAANNVLSPYANKLITEVMNKYPNLPESTVADMIEKAMADTLNDTSWFTMNGTVASNGTYVIHTSKLLDVFQAKIQAEIKSSGAID